MAKDKGKPQTPARRPNLLQGPAGNPPVGMMLHRQETAFTGPIPPPDVLAKYAEVSPGAVEKIFAMAETNAAHVREIESGPSKPTKK
jgi:uncharacterized membrane protein